MKVKVLEKKLNRVCLETPFGNLEGIWCSNDAEKLREYYVELDCDEVIGSANIRKSNTPQMMITTQNGVVILSGLVEEIQDGVLYLRCSKDIFMLEVCPEENLSDFTGQYVEVTIHNLNIYDTGLV